MECALSTHKKPVFPSSTPSAAQLPRTKRLGVAQAAASLTTNPFVSNVEGKEVNPKFRNIPKVRFCLIFFLSK